MPESAAIALYTAAEVRELDRLAIETQGLSAYQLMGRAGQALSDCISLQWPRVSRVCVLCGAGNNGGDGYVLARLLRQHGHEVLVRYLAEPSGLQGAAAQAADEFFSAGGVAEAWAGELPAAGLLVDALLGTGLDRPVEGAFRAAIEAINAHPAAVLAVDIPSGLHADTGRVLGIAVEAQRTLTFIGRKRGLYTAAGVHHAGVSEFADLDVPASVHAQVTAGAQLIDAPLQAWIVQPRRRDTHKGQVGHVLVVGGAPGMAGAARMAAEAAARCGAGLVSIATHPQHAATLNTGCPELMVHGIEAARDLQPLLERASVVVVGPGLGRTDWSRQLLETVLDSSLPLVVDGDALYLLALDPLTRDNWILTPHPGEAARLLGQTSGDIQADRFAAARQLSSDFGGVVVLKGAGTLVARAGQPLRLCDRGNPGMASGGMGDVLSGVLAALLGQGVAAGEAAEAAVYLHARAADLAAAAAGERGLLATDVIPRVRAQLNGRA